MSKPRPPPSATLPSPPEPPPKSFNPIKASPADLVKYGFPPRPDPNSAPKEYAQWQKVMARAQTYVPLKSGLGAPAPAPPPEKEMNNAWSGAYLKTPDPPLPDSETLSLWSVSATYMLTNLYPPASAEEGKPYKINSWVGLDGYSVSSCYQAGTTSTVTQKDGQLTRTETPFFQYINTDPSPTSNRKEYPELAAEPGDEIVVFLWGIVGTPLVCVFMLNLGAREYIIDYFSDGPDFQGTTSEWIVEAILSPAGEQLGFADYGVTFFYDILAINFVLNFTKLSALASGSGFPIVKVYTVDDATLLDIQATSTAKRPKDVMLLYAYDNSPLIS